MNGIENILGFAPKDPSLIQRALTHKSVAVENNELLEFLGDAVLEFCVSCDLYDQFTSYSEGELTLTRAALVNTQSLADAAEKSGVAEHVRYNRAIVEEKARKTIFADAFEAVIGSIFLDQGIGEATRFVRAHVLPGARAILERKSYKDAKTLLQEITQRDMNVTPSYSVIKEEGPDHRKSFEIGVYLKDELFATGYGTSKQEAETRAAEEAIKKLQRNAQM